MQLNFRNYISSITQELYVVNYNWMIILATAAGIIGFVGKLFYDGWATLKHYANTAKEVALIVAGQRKDLDALNKKVDSHSEKLKDQDRKFEEQDKRIDALEAKQVMLKNTCDLHLMTRRKGERLNQ